MVHENRIWTFLSLVLSVQRTRLLVEICNVYADLLFLFKLVKYKFSVYYNIKIFMMTGLYEKLWEN